MRVRSRYSSLLLLVLLLPLTVIQSCKKDKGEFEAIQVQNVEEKLEGRWKVVKLRAIGELDVSGIKFQANGKNTDTPTGYYELTRNPYNYTYDLKTHLEMETLGGAIKQSFDYNDKDAGTWEVSEDEKSVFFRGNQGINQRVYFTHYDSNSTLYMQIAIPIDTVLNGYGYDGTFFIDMSKEG